MSQSGIKHIWFFRPTFPSIKESPFSCNWGDLMIIKNSMLGWSAGWWLGSCTQHQDNDKLWTSGGLQCKYGGAKTGAVVITPAIFSLLTSHSQGRQKCTLRLYLDQIQKLWVGQRLSWSVWSLDQSSLLATVAAGTCDDIDGCACQHSALSSYLLRPTPVTPSIPPLLTLGDSHFLWVAGMCIVRCSRDPAFVIF